MRAWLLRYSSINFFQRNGGTEAATFAALTTLKKQIDREQAVDVYQVNSFVGHFVMAIGTFTWSFSTSKFQTKVCKLLHNKRPGVWRGQEDYLYIHKVLFISLKDPLTKVLHSNMDSLSPCHMVIGQAVEALGQQPLPDENTDAVMGAHSNGKKACYLFNI